jgi:signal transduction histidine kinase
MLIMGLYVFPDSTAAPLATDRRPWQVVILPGANFLLPASMIQDGAMRNTLTAQAPRGVEFFPETLETMRLPDASFETAYVAYLREKYRSVRVDLILAVTTYALNFAEAHGEALWPDVPIVFYSVAEPVLKGRQLKAGITGQTMRFDVGGTIDLAVRLQPGARRFVVVGGNTDNDQYWGVRAGEELRRYSGRLEIAYLTNHTIVEIMDGVRRLSSDSIVLYTSLFRDASGETFVAHDILLKVLGASAAPVYGLFDHFVGTGIVGGSVSSLEEQGRLGATIALRVLNGEKPDVIPVQSPAECIPLVDSRQLVRWGIPEGHLPPNAVVRFREISFWARYRLYIALTLAALVGESLLIAALLIAQRRWRRAESELHHQRTELAHAGRLAVAGELTASIAHEVNQPLAAILSNADAAELLLESGSLPPPGMLKQILADIRRDDLRASEVIRRFRELLRKRDIELEPVDLNSIVSEVMRLLERDAERRGVELKSDLGSNLPVVQADRICLQQVVLNLTLNAMDAMTAMPIARRTVCIRTRAISLNQVEVAVLDSGPGIPTAELPRLFEPYFTTKKEGMGLGLSIARSIIEAHSGSIEAQNRPEGGALLRFTLRTADG